MLYDNIKRMAKAKGLSIAALEKKAGLANGTIGKWRKSAEGARISSLEKIAAALGAGIEDLVKETTRGTTRMNTKQDICDWILRVYEMYNNTNSITEMPRDIPRMRLQALQYDPITETVTAIYSDRPASVIDVSGCSGKDFIFRTLSYM